MKKQEKHRAKWGIISIFLIIAFGTALGGCRLAKEDGDAFKQDELIGMLVTITGPQGDVLAGNDDPETLEGIKTEEGWFEFPEAVGAAITKEYDREADLLSVQGPEGRFLDIHMELNVSDTGEIHKYSGVFMISPDFDGTLYFCPVYAKEDGSVYAVMTGDKYDFFRESFGMEGTISKSVEEESMVVKDGKKEKDASSFTIHVKRQEALEKVTLLEMNRKNEVIGTAKIEENQDTMELHQQTAYVITEMACRNIRGETAIHHAAYDPQEEENSCIQRPYEDENHFICWKNLTLH